MLHTALNLGVPAGGGSLTVTGLSAPAPSTVGGSVSYNGLSVPQIALVGIPVSLPALPALPGL